MTNHYGQPCRLNEKDMAVCNHGNFCGPYSGHCEACAEIAEEEKKRMLVAMDLRKYIIAIIEEGGFVKKKDVANMISEGCSCRANGTDGCAIHRSYD